MLHIFYQFLQFLGTSLMYHTQEHHLHKKEAD
nr:MAG TPA: hypothetical protein [Caudoviricetes sp.]